VPTLDIPKGYSEPITSKNREQVKLVLGFNKPFREETISLFSNNLYEARVIVGTYATMAESYNLVRAAKLVLFQPDWLSLVESQAKARVSRCGQSRPTSTYRLLCANTVDTMMAERHAKGAEFNEAVLGVPSIETPDSFEDDKSIEDVSDDYPESPVRRKYFNFDYFDDEKDNDGTRSDFMPLRDDPWSV
jgi:hypothetical protein